MIRSNKTWNVENENASGTFKMCDAVASGWTLRPLPSFSVHFHPKFIFSAQQSEKQEAFLNVRN